MNGGGRTGSRMGSPAPWTIVIITALTVIAVITSTWAITSHNTTESLKEELANIRAHSNASSYTLEPTESAPSGIQGQVFIGLTGSGVVTASNLPQAGDNEEFRLWFLQDNDTITSGGSLTLNDTGQGFALIPADSTGYVRIAISLESLDATTPAGNYLLIADVRSGRG